jgi:hypothetical protein
MAGQARVLRVIAGCESPLIITARACPVPPRLLAQTLSGAAYLSGFDRVRVDAEQLHERRAYRLALERERTKQAALAHQRDALIWRELEHAASTRPATPAPLNQLTRPRHPTPSGHFNPRLTTPHAARPTANRAGAALPRSRAGGRPTTNTDWYLRYGCPSLAQSRSRPAHTAAAYAGHARGQAPRSGPSPAFPRRGRQR